MSEHDHFSVSTMVGDLAGRVEGEGPPALLLHGGPALGYEYMDPVVEELRTDFRVATFQQRGLEPSTLQGPFTVAQAIADIVSVLDGLGWERAFVVGHSWGAHLALRFTAAYPDRLLGTLAIEPIGVVGDGGSGAFEAELLARVPLHLRERLNELIAREEAGEATPEATWSRWRSRGLSTSQILMPRRRCHRSGSRTRRLLPSQPTCRNLTAAS